MRLPNETKGAHTDWLEIDISRGNLESSTEDLSPHNCKHVSFDVPRGLSRESYIRPSQCQQGNGEGLCVKGTEK